MCRCIESIIPATSSTFFVEFSIQAYSCLEEMSKWSLVTKNCDDPIGTRPAEPSRTRPRCTRRCTTVRLAEPECTLAVRSCSCRTTTEAYHPHRSSTTLLQS
uniref:(northern house mosquito) hypothetical protein n=1 Tax=Culex pipiens TaxID=7175 RepID=A0A8D8MZV0_CULPI